MNDQIIATEEKRQMQLLDNGLTTADRFINRNYLINLPGQQVVSLPEEEKSTGAIRLYKIEKLVYDRHENVNDKLISVYSALQNVDGSAILLLEGTGKEIIFYVGVRSNSNAAIAGRILQKSFIGNFPGSTLKNMRNGEIASVMEHITLSQHENTPKNVSCVTVIPSMRDEDKEKYVQGIEKFIDTMQGEIFTAVLLAKPVSKRELEQRKRGFEELYSTLSPFAKTTLAYGENYSKAVSHGLFENFSHSVNNSVAKTTGHNTGTSISHTHGTNQGYSVNGGGFGVSGGTSDSTTIGYSSGTSFSRAVTEGTADTTGSGSSTSSTETDGTSRTLTIEHQNKSVGVMLEKIDQQLKRMKDCEAFGVWEYAGYFISDDVQTSVVAANTYQALMLGNNTDAENSFLNIWDVRTPQTAAVLEYIRYGQHPLVEIMPEFGYDSQYVTPGNFISGKELPLLMGLPKKSVTGLNVSSIAEFGRNVFSQRKSDEMRQIRLGRVHHMGNTEQTPVNLDMDSFTAHCFITGSTGSGKSNTTYCLLEKFLENKIPFLVVEPAKGEYKDAFGAVEGINILSTNPLIGQMLKLNPFRFDEGIHILEHLDRLIEIFNTCWEMYAAMPAILKEAVEQIYIEKGWDLLNSAYIRGPEPVFPTFSDLMKALPRIISSSAYSSDTQGDYTGALVTRVTSLTNGISGQIFCDSYDIPDNVLFDENTIVDLSRVGSAETKSLIMGILVLRLSEYRMAHARQSNSALRHITVLEEAHNLLKRAVPGSEGSNVVAKSVELICSSIAEMRTYGEGFILVDQSPTSVDIAAIKNTNTKILMRLPEMADCEAAGNAAGLDQDQIKELSKLATGVAVVMQNNWLQAVLTHVDAASGKYEKKLVHSSATELKRLKGVVIQELMKQYIVDREINARRIFDRIKSADASSFKKKEVWCCMRSVIPRLQKGRDIDYFCETLLNFSGTKNLFDIFEEGILMPGSNGDYYSRDSALAWQTAFMKGMSQSLELPEEYCYTLVRYLLYTQELKNGKVNYYELYRILYEGV